MSFFRRKSLFILLIGIIILGTLLGYSMTDRDKISGSEKFIMDSVGWVQNIINKPVDLVVGVFDNMSDIKNTYDENKILREKIAEYKTLAFEVQELKKENEQLRSTLDIQDSPRDFDIIHATVISRSPERWIDQVTINRGSQHGVEKNMAVITADGMIGKINTVSNLTANVQLLTGLDQLNRISAMISRENDDNVFGLIERFDKETNSLVFRIIDESDKNIEEGELIVSSNVGGLFPTGLTIGTIKEVVPDQYGLTKMALVKPTANMFEINHVIVVDRKLDVIDENKQKESE